MKKVLCLLLALVLVFGLTACGSTDNSTTTTAASGSNAETKEATDDGAEKASTIKIGVSGTPDLDPAIASTGSSLIAAINIYDTLVYPSDTEESGIEGRVAESWTVSDDGLTYTFKLKQGIKFHSGNELKAADVVYSMDRLLTIGQGYAYIFSNFVDAGSTVAVDDYTVEFHLKSPYGPFANALIRLFIVDSETVKANTVAGGAYGDNGDYGTAWLVEHDAGSGAYKAVKLVQQDYFYAEKNPDWFMGWTNAKAPEAFKQMAITEATTVRTMINNKELDITDTWQSTETLAALEKMDGVSIAKLSNGLEYNMYFNNQAAPMDDVNFRRAISSLIDYNTICSTILIDSVPAAGPTPAGVTGHVDTFQFTYDLDKAKEYLAASKYANNAADYPIEIVVNSDVAGLEKIALMVQSAAQQVGITITISKAPWVSLIDKMGSAETSPQITMINSAPPFDDAGVYLQSRYSNATQGTWENGEWFADSKVNDMILEALQITDTATRLQKYADIQNYIVDELCASGWLCDMTERCAYQSGYIKWPFVENADGVAHCVNGYSQIFCEMEYNK